MAQVCAKLAGQNGICYNSTEYDEKRQLNHGNGEKLNETNE